MPYFNICRTLSKDFTPSVFSIIIKSVKRPQNKVQHRKGVQAMPNGLEITKAAIDDFKKIQDYMVSAKKENATETSRKLKKEYLSLKAILTVAGVNLTDIDEIKE